jgi:fatty acid desaturase
MFAHGVELDHEIGHQNYFSKSWMNRWVGFFLAAPFLISHTRYRLSHAHHHKMVGTPEDKESFNYDYQSLQNFFGFVKHLSMVGHYKMASSRIMESFSMKGVTQKEASVSKVTFEYRLMGVLVVVLFFGSWYFNSLFALTHWLIPLLIAAGPIHALIELPEHLYCNQDSPDIFLNTRTITAGKFMHWFTNGNCWHVEHHIYPSLSIDQLPKKHQEIKDDIMCLHSSYWSFYSQVLKTIFDLENKRPSTTVKDNCLL